MSSVKMWEETIVIPTYPVDKPDHNPRFYEKRAYQGSTGKVYPLPVTEKIYDDKVDQEYKAVFIENDYLQVMVLPELGGRIQRAIDKTNNYDFVYYNHVIKPALVGLTGPWISGGIEFNWPQHHRPSTYSPTEYKLIENKDGSQSIWVSEIDKMYGTKGMATFTLHPDKAYIEIKGQVYNRTDLPQTFLWWANPAVPANDHTSSIFPPDVTAVMDHGKRAVSTFPIATGEYYKADYSAGVDISKYKNIPVPTSYMAEKSDFDFIGSYDAQIEAGLLHVADHHISPGKKQWTWGNGDFGQAWDDNLTDNDGPYVELMTGVFTDNQPDFTWLQPYEEKVFTQYFMPYKGVGSIKNATIDAAVNLEKENNKASIYVYVTGVEKDLTIHVLLNENVLFETKEDLTPKSFYTHSFFYDGQANDSDLFTVRVKNADGKILVQYDEVDYPEPDIPEPAEAIPVPSELQTTEELFLAATHLEQYRHATSVPEDYYEEGLKRDPTDSRLNTGYGKLLYRHGHFEEAEKHLRAAVEKQMWKSPNPYNGEPLFHLGLTLEIQNKKEEAFSRFYKATWNQDTQSAAFYKLAALSSQKEQWEEALAFVQQALIKNAHHMKARMLEILLLEQLGQDYSNELEKGLEIDPLDLALNRKHAQLHDTPLEYKRVMRNEVQNYLVLALDYIQYGFYKDALDVLKEYPVESPLIGYYQAYIYTQLGEDSKARAAVKKGEKAPSTYCFPNRVEEIIILEHTIALVSDAHFAKYYLGNLYYDKKQYERAINLWEEASQNLIDFPTVYRNLAFAYYNKHDNPTKALRFIERSFEINPKDSRVLLEKTQLEQLMGHSISKRLTALEEHLPVTQDRDDLFIEYLTLLNLQGRHEDVLNGIKDRIFHPWEGGEGKISSQYTYALTELGRKAIQTDSIKAKELLKSATVFPRHLGEGKLPSNHSNVAHYYLGQVEILLGREEEAKDHFTQAMRGLEVPGNVLYYNDEPADVLFYQGLAFAQLGDKKQAEGKFKTLIAYGEEHIEDDINYDFFAVSAPVHSVFDNDRHKDNAIYCTYLIGLGKLGQKDYTEALKHFKYVLELDPSHQGAIQHMPFAKDKHLP